ncbi:uncharacterized protein LOC127241198 [Andrographis paniculata]|uniref:uncharacterized protein LOC127241198 n=1 Tax=Andrographis paniculata TaxID=175694 RepID=UPI0021E90ADD|nr:uncharacterized protein LOC127241198 [Andrographis paniculata]
MNAQEPRVQVVKAANNNNNNGSNICSILSRRELSSRAPKSFLRRNCNAAIGSWAEGMSLRNLSSSFCSLEPPPEVQVKKVKSTTFNADGTMLAANLVYGTKLIDTQTERCIQLADSIHVIWPANFHPIDRDVLTNRTMMAQVSVWNVNTSAYIRMREFDTIPRFLSFHAQKEILAVGTEDEIFIWQYREGLEEEDGEAVDEEEEDAEEVDEEEEYGEDGEEMDEEEGDAEEVDEEQEYAEEMDEEEEDAEEVDEEEEDGEYGEEMDEEEEDGEEMYEEEEYAEEVDEEEEDAEEEDDAEEVEQNPILRTNDTLRLVCFHPCVARCLLTAEECIFGNSVKWVLIVLHAEDI